jgi:hypothetical protein
MSARGDLEAYRFHLHVYMCFECNQCGRRIEALDDILPSEEDAVPDGAWADRHGQWAMDSGWFVQPLSAADDFVSHLCFCPSCAQRHACIIAQ